MNAATTGTQSPLKNDKQNPQVHGNHSHASQPESSHQELTPDRPPQPVDAADLGENRSKRPRGFAAMDRQLVSEIARKGGKAAHSAGTAHEFTSEEARVAGRKGGRATHAKRRKPGEDASLSPESAQSEKTGE